MSRATIAPPDIKTLADLQRRLGGIPLERIRFHPAPGTAMEKNLLEAEQREGTDGRIHVRPAEHGGTDENPADELERDGGQRGARQNAEHERREERDRRDHEHARERQVHTEPSRSATKRY